MTKRVAILGGGYTGLIAALRLSQAGYSVTIFEKSGNVGGLASGFKIENAPLEKAYHHLFKTDKYIINLVNELNIEDKLIWHDSSTAIFYNNNLYPFEGALDLLRFKPLSFLNRLRAGLVILYLQKTTKWQKLQSISAYKWMLKYSGKQVTEVIWEPLLKGKFNKFYDQISMAWLWARINTRAQSRVSGKEKLGYFEGGFETFTGALIAKLKKQEVDIRLNITISEIQKMENNKIKLVFDASTSLDFDYCLATVPSNVFSKLIKNNTGIKRVYLKKLNNTKYLGARLIIFSSTQEITKFYWHNINDMNLPFLVFINHTRLVNKSKFKNKYVYYIATYASADNYIFKCTDTELENLWFKNLVKVFPNFDKNKIHEVYHFKFANAQHIVNNNYWKSIPKFKTPIENVFLANFSQIYPEDRGTNYAVRDGEKVAQIIIDRNK